VRWKAAVRTAEEKPVPRYRMCIRCGNGLQTVPRGPPRPAFWPQTNISRVGLVAALGFPQPGLVLWFLLQRGNQVSCFSIRFPGKKRLENSEILQLAQGDFEKWLSESTRGRKSKYTTEEILRSLMVMFVEGDSCRDVVIRIDGSDFLRRFVGIGTSKPMMDSSFLSRALSALQPETVAAMNRVLAEHAAEEET